MNLEGSGPCSIEFLCCRRMCGCLLVGRLPDNREGEMGGLVFLEKLRVFECLLTHKRVGCSTFFVFQCPAWRGVGNRWRESLLKANAYDRSGCDFTTSVSRERKLENKEEEGEMASSQVNLVSLVRGGVIFSSWNSMHLKIAKVYFSSSDILVLWVFSLTLKNLLRGHLVGSAD